MQLCLTPKPVLHGFPNLQFCLVTCWNTVYLIMHYPEQGAVLPVRFGIIRIIVCTQQDVQGQSLELSWFKGKQHSSWCTARQRFQLGVGCDLSVNKKLLCCFKAVLRHVQDTQRWHEQWHWAPTGTNGRYGSVWASRALGCDSCHAHRGQPRKAGRAVDCVLSCNLSSCSPSIAIRTE